MLRQWARRASRGWVDVSGVGAVLLAAWVVVVDVERVLRGVWEARRVS